MVPRSLLALARALACAVALSVAALPAAAQPADAGPSPASGAVAAGTAGPNAVPASEADDDGEGSPLGRLVLAQDLFQLARRGRDPVLALAALRLAAAVGSVELARAPVEEVAGRPSRKTGSLGPPEVPEMAALARQLADGDAALLRLVAEAEQPARDRGRLAGPALTRARIEAGARIAYAGPETTFRGGEPAQILLTGDGDADLDLLVLDDAGNEVCRSSGPADREYCHWIPRWTGRFRIVIINLGSVWSDFALRTN